MRRTALATPPVEGKAKVKVGVKVEVESAPPTACAFVSVKVQDRFRPKGYRVDLVDLVSRIDVESAPASPLADVGPTVAVRLVGLESSHLVEVLLDASAALALAERIAEQARRAQGESSSSFESDAPLRPQPPGRLP
jgi:hypothetical protein